MYFPVPPELGAECVVLNTRRAVRSITRCYNPLARPFGLQRTQVPLLTAVAAREFDSVSEMAEQLAVERTTLTRNLQVLRRRVLFTSRIHGQGRARRFELTDTVARLLKAISPPWMRAQQGLRNECGDAEWSAVQAAMKLIGDVG